MSDLMDALQVLIDGGLQGDAVGAVTLDLLEHHDDIDDARGIILLDHLNSDGYSYSPDDVTEVSYDDTQFDAGGGTYMVLTEEESDIKAGEYVEESLWAFNADFLSGITQLPTEVFTALQDQCEGANDTFRKLIDGTCGIDEVVNQAISSDGKGHFLAGYDGEEIEVCGGGNYFYIYRTN